LDPYSAVDSAGRPVSCPAAIIPPLVVARICSSSGPALHCDFNGDGREDIRDLVLMVQCLRDSAQCGSTERFDCNGDGVFNLDDVLCCASRIIGEECAGCPDDTVRGAARIKVAIGPPLGRLSMPDLPLQLEGADLIGGARLSLRYPDDRYDVLGVDVGGAAASWIHLSQASGGRVRIGLIDPAAGPGSLTQASVTLHLALKPGRVAGGEVAIEGADFSARDGVKLAAAVPALRQPLGASPGLQLSANQPNPFAGSTRFVVTLERSGPVEVAVFDLGGRRLATLQRGVLSAGTHEFTWDGRIADGSRARDGVYFYRVASGSETLARKLVLLRSP
jgi:hypothetical protein